MLTDFTLSTSLTRQADLVRKGLLGVICTSLLQPGTENEERDVPPDTDKRLELLLDSDSEEEAAQAEIVFLLQHTLKYKFATI